MNKNNLILYIGILIFGLAAPFIFPAFKVQLSILCILIVLATTWNIQGGEMGYNTFGNILFYGLGMYLCASVHELKHTNTYRVHRTKYFQMYYSPSLLLEYSK